MFCPQFYDIYFLRRSHLHSKWSSSEIWRKFHVLRCSFSSTESDVSICLAKTRTVIDRISIDRSYWLDKMWFLPNRCCDKTTVRMQHMGADKTYKEKLDGKCTRMLWTLLNKSWEHQPMKQQQLYGYLPPNSKTIQIGRKIHLGHLGYSWRRKKQELIYTSVLIQDIVWKTCRKRYCRFLLPDRTWHKVKSPKAN